MALGFVANANIPAAPPITLETGDLVCLFTDGVFEALNMDGETFGTERALNVIRLSRQKPSREIIDDLYIAVRSFRGDFPQVDDFTTVLIKAL